MLQQAGVPEGGETDVRATVRGDHFADDRSLSTAHRDFEILEQLIFLERLEGLRKGALLVCWIHCRILGI